MMENQTTDEELFGEPCEPVPVDQLELAAFFAQLAANQEPLSAEFEKVLADNLEALYVRD